MFVVWAPNNTVFRHKVSAKRKLASLPDIWHATNTLSAAVVGRGRCVWFGVCVSDNQGGEVDGVTGGGGGRGAKLPQECGVGLT